ncbi:hypothetical protein GCM10020370_41330 [Paenibacillus hodogayensis]
MLGDWAFMIIIELDLSKDFRVRECSQEWSLLGNRKKEGELQAELLRVIRDAKSGRARLIRCPRRIRRTR